MKKSAVIFLFAVSLALSACFSPWKGDVGTFSISTGGGNGGGRAALPWNEDLDVGDLVHIITLNGPGPRQSVSVTGAQVVQFSVVPGFWDISIEAYEVVKTDGEERRVLQAVGSKKVEIKPGPNDAIIIPMEQPPVIEPEPPVEPEPPEEPEPPVEPEPPEEGNVTITLIPDESGTMTPNVNYDKITISRSAANSQYPVTLSNPDDVFTNIKWEVPGVGAGKNVTGSENSFTLDAANPNYNAIGNHVLYLTFEWHDAPYLVEIEFEVVE